MVSEHSFYWWADGRISRVQGALFKSYNTYILLVGKNENLLLAQTQHCMSIDYVEWMNKDVLNGI